MRSLAVALLVLSVVTPSLVRSAGQTVPAPGGPSGGGPPSEDIVLNSTAAASRSWLFGADLGANDGSSTLFRIDASDGALSVIGELGRV